jgi:hypothetical protein
MTPFGTPNFWDYKNDPDLLNDPGGWRWFDRQVKRVLDELNQTDETRS